MQPTTAKADSSEVARTAKLAHAFFLAKLCRERIDAQPEFLSLLLPDSHLRENYFQGAVFSVKDGAKILLKCFARQWRITDKNSLRTFTPVEVAKLVHELRKFLLDAGVRIPPGRSREKKERAALDGPATKKTMNLVYDYAARLGLSQVQFDGFTRHQLARKHRSIEIRTELHARAVLAGLRGTFRHRGTEPQRGTIGSRSTDKALEQAIGQAADELDPEAE